MIRSTLGVVAGVIVAMVVTMASQAGIHLLYPPPPGDYTDPAVQAAAMARAPAASLILVASGYGLAALAGGLVACLVARRHGRPAWIIGGLLVLGTVLNIAMLPHPLWFGPLAIALIAAGSWLGGRVIRPTT